MLMFYSLLYVILMQNASTPQLEILLSVCDVSAILDVKTLENVGF